MNMETPRLIEAFLRTEEKEAAIAVCSTYTHNGLFREADACMERLYPAGLSSDAQLILKVFAATLLFGFIVGIVRCYDNDRDYLRCLRCMRPGERFYYSARLATHYGLVNVLDAAKIFAVAFALLLGVQVLFA